MYTNMNNDVIRQKTHHKNPAKPDRNHFYLKLIVNSFYINLLRQVKEN